jgi:hypothetical protein
LNYNKGKKDDAAFYFASVVKNYPKSPKAPDAMFKVGVIMQDKGDTAKAKAVYQQVVTNSRHRRCETGAKTSEFDGMITHDQKSRYFWSCRMNRKQLSDLHRNFCCAEFLNQ